MIGLLRLETRPVPGELTGMSADALEGRAAESAAAVQLQLACHAPVCSPKVAEPGKNPARCAGRRGAGAVKRASEALAAARLGESGRSALRVGRKDAMDDRPDGAEVRKLQ